MKRVLVIPGDGIGREIVPATCGLIERAADRHGLRLSFETRDAGAQAFLDSGMSITPQTRKLAAEADAILLGAIGLPDVRRADGTEIADEVVLDLRTDLDLFANVRPVRSWPRVAGPLNRQDIDYTVVRENTEGLYLSHTGGVVLGKELVADTMIITRKGTERVVRHAFEIASASNGRPLDGKRAVTCVDKANTLKGYVLFRSVFEDVASEFPDIVAECEHADAMTVRMVRRPESLNVLVCENMIGDILSDLAAATVGGLGLAPSANIGHRHGLFEPVHGSAPDIAGRGIANPLATILSGAMMLDWFGRRDPAALRAASSLRDAVETILKDGVLTADLGGQASLADVIAAIEEQLR